MQSTLSQQTENLKKFMSDHTDVDQVSEKEIIHTYQELIDCLTDHNHLYYIENKPIISDLEYDELFSYLKKIEEHYPHIISSNSPTQELIGQIAEGFKQAPHKNKLLSLENTYNAEDILEWEKRINKELEKQENIQPATYAVTPKFDGISVELIYKDKKFYKAITRGDGAVGEDITENVKMIFSIPKELKGNLREDKNITELSIRGEIMMPHTQREKINKEKEAKGESPFANTRNAAAGSIKLLDANEVKRRGLVCFVYDLIYCESEKDFATNHEEIMQNLKNMGLPVFEWEQYTQEIQGVITLCDESTKSKLQSYPYDFDGLVIKINELPIRDILGSTAHHPRWQIAYKFPAEQTSTKINSVDFQVGRTGIITPVANLEPVQLSGVTISRVSLHNFDFIKDKDIHIGDYVWLQRSGEVIPYILAAIPERRENVQAITAPTSCPSCGEPITQIDIHNYCTNIACPTQIKEKLIHFVSKDCMDIEGIGDSIIDILVDQKLLTNFSDLYQINNPNIRLKIHSIPGFGDKKLFEISQQLEEAKHKPLRRLLNALGIPGIGKKTAQQIQESLQACQGGDCPFGGVGDVAEQVEFQKLLNTLQDTEFLKSIYGIGEKIISGIQTYIQQNEEIIRQLQTIGLNFSPTKFTQASKADAALSGQHFAITGTFPVGRTEIIKAFEAEGAIFDAQPNKSTDYILIGEKAGSKKTKAQEMGITIHEGRDNMLAQFPFLADISTSKTNKPQGPVAQSLF